MAKSQTKTAKGKNAQRTPHTITAAANILGISRRATSQAARAGKLVGVYGGLMGNRLIGITVESVDAVLEYRKAHKPPLRGDDYMTRDLRPAAR